MAETSFRKFYAFNEFLALTALGFQPHAEAFDTFLATYGLAVVPDLVAVVGGDTVMVEWESYPSSADIALVDAAVAEFDQIAATSQSFALDSFDLSTDSSGSPVVKVDLQTLPLTAGLWRISWVSSIATQGNVPGTGVRAIVILNRSDGAEFQQTHGWDLSEPQAYNGSVPFDILVGQTLRARLGFQLLGVGNVAQMAGCRVTIDKVD